MMEDYQHQAEFPSLPPHAIIVEQSQVLKPLNHPRNMDIMNSHSHQARQVLHGTRNVYFRSGQFLPFDHNHF